MAKVRIEADIDELVLDRLNAVLKASPDDFPDLGAAIEFAVDVTVHAGLQVLEDQILQLLELSKEGVVETKPDKKRLN